MSHVNFNADGVPNELREHTRFLPYELRPEGNGKFSKVPQRISPSGPKNASAQDPANWITWSEVESLKSTGGWSHFGWAFANNTTGILGLDLDHCRDPITGHIDDWAAELVQAFGSYSEVSPSGRGIHIWIRLTEQGDPAAISGKRELKSGASRKVEIFFGSLWMTLTGVRPEQSKWHGLRQTTESTLLAILEDQGFLLEQELVASDKAHCAGSGVTPLEMIVEALQYIPSDDYTDWVRVGLALKNEYGDRGFAIWNQWSATSAKFDHDVALRKWRSFGQSHPAPVGVATVLWLARRAGYRPTQRQGWVRRLRSTTKGPIPDEANILICLQYDPFLQDLVAYDAFAQRLHATRTVTSTNAGSESQPFPRDWRDSDSVELLAYLQAPLFPKMGKDRVDSAIRLFGEKYRSFHPLQDYLLALRWDGTRRVERWLETYLGATGKRQDAEYVRAVGQCWLVSGVARALQPGCQADHVLVLEGPQGCGKTTALRVLGGQFFSDSLPHDLSHKDARDHLRGVWIVELAELTQLKKSEIEFVKSFISRREEKFRPAYGRHEVHYPRFCIFAGTTNDSQHLIDSTGNRRFWSVSVGNIDLSALERDRDQLWAEAVVLYQQGVLWHLDPSLSEKARAEADGRVMTDPWLHRVSEAVESHPLVLNDTLLPSEVLCAIATHEQAQTPHNARRVAFILRQLGWLPGKRTKRGQLYQRPKSITETDVGEVESWQL